MAIILLRLIIPSDSNFTLTKEAGGLEISYTQDEALREKYGWLNPEEILACDEKVADCTEYSCLLVSFLRAAGIKSGVNFTIGHAYVVANLD